MEEPVLRNDGTPVNWDVIRARLMAPQPAFESLHACEFNHSANQGNQHLPWLYVVTGGGKQDYGSWVQGLAKRINATCIDVDDFLPRDNIYGIRTQDVENARIQHINETRRALLDHKPVVACHNHMPLYVLATYCDMRCGGVIYCDIRPCDSGDHVVLPWHHYISKSIYACGDGIRREATVMQVSNTTITAQLQAMHFSVKDMTDFIQGLDYAMQTGGK